MIWLVAVMAITATFGAIGFVLGLLVLQQQRQRDPPDGGPTLADPYRDWIEEEQGA